MTTFDPLVELAKLEAERDNGGCKCVQPRITGHPEDCYPGDACDLCIRIAELEEMIDAEEPVCPFCGYGDLEEGGLCLRCRQVVTPVTRKDFEG